MTHTDSPAYPAQTPSTDQTPPHPPTGPAPAHPPHHDQTQYSLVRLLPSRFLRVSRYSLNYYAAQNDGRRTAVLLAPRSTRSVDQARPCSTSTSTPHPG
ncbi:hypothetical protein EKN07_11540 [Actinobaculum sp. 352]|nr:hypothetical protein EKN07_11540 [Actinobaculum sp. 352]